MTSCRPCLRWAVPTLFMTVAGLALAAHSFAGFQSSSRGSFIPLYGRESVVADFDSDGRPDFATHSASSFGVVVVYRNLGATGFVAMDSLSAVQSGSIEVADLDADGNPDLLAEASGTTSVWLGNGDFTFDPRQDYTVETSTSVQGGIAVGDLVGTSLPDVVAPDSAAALVVWQNVGGGALVPIRTMLTAGSVQTVRLADLDHDADLDVVVLENHCSGCTPAQMKVRVFVNQGGAVFGPGVQYDSNRQHGLDVADLDADGHPDVLAGAFWFKGHGDGSFDAGASYGGPDETAATMADLDLDGEKDLISSSLVYDYLGCSSCDSIYVRPGQGGLPLASPVVAHSGLNPREFDVADFNGDSHPDLLATMAGAPEVRIHWGNGQGTFPPLRTYPAGGAVQRVAIADMTGEGMADVLTLSPAQNLLRLLRGTGGGTLGTPLDFAAPSGATAMATGDFDADTRADVALLTGSELTVFTGSSSGLDAPVSYPLPGTGFALAAGDVTADGIPDVLVSSTAPDLLSVFPGTNGGGLGVRVDYVLGANFGARLTVAHANGDAHPDAVVSGGASGRLWMMVFPGQANGTFGAAVSSDLGLGLEDLGLRHIVVADHTGDGIADLAIARGASSVSNFLYRSTGSAGGIFSAALGPQLFLGRDVRRGIAADVDADGRLDLVFANAGAGAAGVTLGRAGFQFSEPATYGGVRNATDVAAGDLNSDGRLDLVLAGDVSQTVAVLLNDAAGTLAVPDAEAIDRERFALRAWPTVARDDITLEFSLPARGDVSLELYDLAGRRLLARDLGVIDAGPQSRTLALPRELPAGLIWIRMSQGAHRAIARAVVAR